MWKALALGTALIGFGASLAADAQQQQGDPLNGQFGAIEIALSPAEAADDTLRLADALSKLPPQRPGIVDTYILSASLWNEPVFENEAKEAASILARRYDATDRTITLSAGRGVGAPRAFPVMNPNNFNAVLGRIGKIADPNEDLVVVFVTSHGGPDGGVVMQEKGRLGGALRALQLRNSLQQANIKTKMVIVSACFSGYFILPFTNDDTVVLTAAAADKTSFGCEPQRDWTYFGDALFNHALRGGAGIADSFDMATAQITQWENDLHAQWAAKPASQRSQQREPLPSNPQKNFGEHAIAVVAKAESYGAAIACAGHLSFAMDRAKVGRPLKGLADTAATTSAQAAAQARAISEGAARGRSSQDTAKAIVANATTALSLYPTQSTLITDQANRCMAP
jgi:hypothetical protein